jgi:glycosyltransferase involved in cell wall biosynthesis
MATMLDDVPITLIGHPWAPIGMGEQLRSQLAAARALHIDAGVFDIFRYAKRTDAAHARLIGDAEREGAQRGIRVFHINGDEIERVLEAFAARGNDFDAGYNIIVPAWELPTYPAEWAAQLARFDEVWALSRFIGAGLQAAGVASHLVGQAAQPECAPFLPRRHFGIRESAFVLLTFFDLSSYAARKNPEAVIALFERLRGEAPFRDLQLVVKAKNVEADAAEWAATLPQDPLIKVIAEPLDTFGVHSLINCCDCCVSLHRAEGFGRGPAEAMALGRLALATGWSGNLDFMTESNSLLVRHSLRKLKRDEYPHWKGQSWAEPDVDHAAQLLAPVLDDPARGAAIARRGQMDVLRSHGNRAVGLRMLDRFCAIIAESPKVNAAAAVSAAVPGTRRRHRVHV